MEFSSYQNDCKTKKEDIGLMHKHNKGLNNLICIHRITHKFQYKSTIVKNSCLCSGTTIHVQQIKNSIKIEELTSGWMLVKMHNWKHGLSSVPYAAPIPTCQNHSLVQYFSALLKGRMAPRKESSLILHHSMMGRLLDCAHYTFSCLLCMY